MNGLVLRHSRALSLFCGRSCGGDTRREAGVRGLGGSWAWGGAHIALRGHRTQQGRCAGCKGKGEGEGWRAYLRPPGRIARWRSASKHLVEDGVEGGGGFRATMACQAMACQTMAHQARDELGDTGICSKPCEN